METDDIVYIDDIVSLIDDDEDELDLVKLVSTNANDTNQYLLFLGSDNQYYAKNVSKIEELLVYKEIDIAYNHDNNYILGTANIRGEITPIVNFDHWIGNKVLDDSEYELVIIVAYGGKRFALVVKEVEYIVAIDSSNMVSSHTINSKSSFTSKVTINGKEQLCTIFDSDIMLIDIFGQTQEQSNIELNNITEKSKSDKIILFADDSKLIRTMVEKLFKKYQYKYKIYQDGQDLIDDLQNINTEQIGLIITDLEMPRAGGKEVIEFIRNDIKYNHINILVHTNMSNDVIEEEIMKKQVSKIIDKVDMPALSKAIEEFMI